MSATPRPAPDFYCTDWANAIGEEMVGTALFGKVWFLLEYTQPWHAQAPSDNDLPQPIQAWLTEQSTLVNGHLQFIKQPRGERTGWAFFVACFADVGSRVYRFDLDSYDELLQLDLPAIVAGEAQYAAALTDALQFLVCSHGKRDVCCALHGVALLRVLAAAGTAVWETTHLGGHRFAPLLLTLPDGLSYGRLSPEDVPQLLTHVKNRTVWPEKLRGRSCYQPVEQVAEHCLRQETAVFHQDAYQHVGTELVNEGVWQVQFQTKAGQSHTVTVEADEPLMTYPSSGSMKTKIVPKFRQPNPAA